MQNFPELLIDGYKLDHKRQYPVGSEIVVSNMTPRTTRRGPGDGWKVVQAGHQYLVLNYLIKEWNENFFQQPKEEVLIRFKQHIDSYVGKGNQVGIHHIAALHDLGYLPIEVRALPEGTVYPLKVPGVVIWNTHHDFFWITNYLETLISTTLWGTSTSATTARHFKQLLTFYAMATVGNADFVPFQAHDFSFRGMMGLEAACMSGFGHLTSFAGTDTIPAIRFAEEYYGARIDQELVGCSVPATEHSVMCAGEKDNELETFRRLIEDLYPSGIVSIVADTWDFWHVVTPNNGLLVQLKDKIMARDGKVVIRPDTGDPVKIVTGEAMPVTEIDALSITKAITRKYNYVRHGAYYYEIIRTGSGHGARKLADHEVTDELKGAIQCLWDTFGGTMTAKGFRSLDSHIGLIYGDSITHERAKQICENLELMGFASTNIVFGVGSFTYAYTTRDTDGYAVKATWIQVNGEAREIFKDPKTGDGTKKSAKGLVAVFKDEKGEFYAKDQATWDELLNCELLPIFRNGKALNLTTLAEIRARLNTYDEKCVL